MASKKYFDNPYKSFSPEGSNDFMNSSNDGLSEVFTAQQQKFEQQKLHYFSSEYSELLYELGRDETVYTGSAGMAFYYLMKAIKMENNKELFIKAFQCLRLNKIKGRRISFLCGDAGPLAIASVIAYKLQKKNKDLPENLPDFKLLIKRLLNLSSLIKESPDELLYGKAGYLYALLFVNKYTDAKSISATHISQVIDGILASGRMFSSQMKSESPLLYQWHDKIYFGAAHGMAGILFMLLQARNHINVGDMYSFIQPSIQWLLKQRNVGGNFYSSLGSASGDRLVQWCHGAPGLVPLCLLAHEVFKQEFYLKVAETCGEVVWQRGLCSKGYSICHGVSGNAYAFLQLYQATMKPEYLYRAACFAEWSTTAEKPHHELHPPDRPASLFEGLAGRLYLASDIVDPSNALFPAMCL